MKTHKLALFTFITSIVCMNAAANNVIYKWKDTNGVVHYGQNAPKGQEVEIITTKTPKGALPETSPTTKTDKKTVLPITQTAGDDEKKDKEKAAPTVGKDPATCDKATKAIQDLQRPIVTMDGKVMTIDQKNEQLSHWDEVQKVHCP
jgi:hypothetical protein